MRTGMHLARPALASLLLAMTNACFVPPAQAAMNCSTTVSSLAYGIVSVINNTPVDSTATITISCNFGNNAPQNVRLCVSVQDPAIAMNSGANALNQRLYKDAARSQLFGSFVSTPNGGVQLDLAGRRNFSATVTLYGRIPSAQFSPPGAYSVSMPATNLRIFGNESTSLSCQQMANGGAGYSGNLTLIATASVSAECRVSASPLNFGTSGTLATNVDGSATLSLTCTSSTPYSIALNGGLTGASDPTQRKMTRNAHQITYGLYRDPGRTQSWGSTVGSNTVQGTGTGGQSDIGVFGRVAPQAAPAPGIYSDTITATVTY